MKRLNKPDFNPAEVYQACMDGVADPSLLGCFNVSKAAFEALALRYDDYAAGNQLYKIAASDHGKLEQIVFANLTKGALLDLYSKSMVGKRTAGRIYYDKLIMLAPHGKCPYCWFGHVSTLDHFLAKSRYPAFAVLPANLVPSCADCNTGKGASVLAEKKQIPHPYFVEAAIETDAWLFAEIVATRPATAKFFVQPPTGWPQDFSIRLHNYFLNLNLAERFAIEAASEIVSVCDMLRDMPASEMRKTYVETMAKSERKHRRNFWRAALCEALAASEWFICEGYAAA